MINESAATAAKEVPFRERLTAPAREVQRHTGISESTLYEMARNGELRTVKLRGRKLFDVPFLVKRLGV